MYKREVKIMNSNIIKFKSEKEKEEYEKYEVVRGECLYQKVAEFLNKELKLNDSVDFTIVSDWVRYDKAIKKVLYVFLSTLEEHFKRIIVAKFEYLKNDFVPLKKQGFNLATFDVVNGDEGIKIKIKKVKKTYYGVFSCFANWTKTNGPVDNFTAAELRRINDLRNRVMHMSFIALPIFGYEELKSDLKLIREKLPKPWNEGFTKGIIGCQFSKDGDGKRTVPRSLKLEKYIIKEI
jgi:hypothetical protein